MKVFKSIREGATVWNKKLAYKGKKIPVIVKKEGSKYMAYVDGDTLGKFNSLNDAKKSIELTMKELG